MRRMDMKITVDLAHGIQKDEDADCGFFMKHWWIIKEARSGSTIVVGCGCGSDIEKEIIDKNISCI